MPSELDNLKTRRTAVATTLAALVSKPDYSADGRSFQHVGHRKALLEEYRQLCELINLLEPGETSITATP